MNDDLIAPQPLKVHITKLEMTAPPRAHMASPSSLHIALMRVPEIPLNYYRFLYRQVGSRWQWVDRVRMSDDELTRTIHNERTTITVLYVEGAPAGFYEYQRRDDNVTELVHFGLFERALGLGIGKWFLLQGLYAIWADEPEKVVTTTNNLDHPRALQLYQRFGFSPVSTHESKINPLSDDELLAFAKRF
ncbi:GNAT family N-acetyltransferase [Martelella mediterranea]|uniref:Acetyltransferase (GNAT) family protein n=1 Tax=Martelella mediterranea TaxID=293089 RepID=A0A4R3NST8_9HYPH|nr:GNAT family N-acetyltransferase [Martelella mediterranea]TCT40301.1 acetyltransferase (GNAT) family protein [Martelella mediterranea]